MEILTQYWSQGGVREEPCGSYTADGEPLMDVSGSSLVVEDGQLFVHTEGTLVSGWALVRIGPVTLFVEVRGSVDASRTFSQDTTFRPATREVLTARIASLEPSRYPEYWYPEREAEDAAEIAAFRAALALIPA